MHVHAHRDLLQAASYSKHASLAWTEVQAYKHKCMFAILIKSYVQPQSQINVDVGGKC